MLVKNKTVSITHLAFPRTGIPDLELRKKYAKTKFSRGLTFLPGVNDVPDELLALFEDNKLVRRMFEDDDKLEVVKGAPKKAEVSLSELKAGQAVKLVRETIDVELLTRWRGEEEREDVIKAIDARLKKLEPEGKEKDEGGEQGGGEPS